MTTSIPVTTAAEVAAQVISQPEAKNMSESEIQGLIAERLAEITPEPEANKDPTVIIQYTPIKEKILNIITLEGYADVDKDSTPLFRNLSSVNLRETAKDLPSSKDTFLFPSASVSTIVAKLSNGGFIEIHDVWKHFIVSAKDYSNSDIDAVIPAIYVPKPGTRRDIECKVEAIMHVDYTTTVAKLTISHIAAIDPTSVGNADVVTMGHRIKAEFSYMAE